MSCRVSWKITKKSIAISLLKKSIQHCFSTVFHLSLTGQVSHRRVLPLLTSILIEESNMIIEFSTEMFDYVLYALRLFKEGERGNPKSRMIEKTSSDLQLAFPSSPRLVVSPAVPSQV